MYAYVHMAVSRLFQGQKMIMDPPCAARGFGGSAGQSPPVRGGSGGRQPPGSRGVWGAAAPQERCTYVYIYVDVLGML